MGLFDFLKPKDELYSFHVAGVTFKNGNKSRQTILRAIKEHKPPFAQRIDITMQNYDFEGEIAIGVYTNGLQIGNVPRDKIQFLIDNYSRIINVNNLEIVGGNGLSYGAVVTLKMKI